MSNENVANSALQLPNLERRPMERRALISIILSTITVTAAVVACIPLFSVLIMLLFRGGQRLSLELFYALPAPLYQKWFRTYNGAHPNALIDYQPLGSGGGVVQVPMTAGALVLIYNLKDVGPLKLTLEAYTGIFLGTVSRWNDPLIADANPVALLPDTPVILVTRSDASGTTYTLTRHLRTASPEFESTVGVAKSLQLIEQIH
jgi:ABC-type phosphate transport system substrate-binding protein